MARRTLEFGLTSDVIWYVGDSGRLDKTEWAEFVSFVRVALAKPHIKPVRAWSVGYGTGPDALQRKTLLDEMMPYDVLVAVNTDSVIARGVVAAFAWFKPNFAAFDIGDREGAAAHLQLDRKTTADVLVSILAAEGRMRR